MTSKGSPEDMPLLDQWLAEAGDEGIIAAVEAALLGIAEGRLLGFSNKDELDEYLQRPRLRTA